MKFLEELLSNRGAIALLYIGVILLITFIVKNILSKKNVKGNYSSWIFTALTIIFALTFFKDDKFMNVALVQVQDLVINVKFILITALTFILATKLTQFLIETVLKKVYESYNVDVNLRFTFNSTLKMLLMFIAVLIALNTLGLSLSSLAVFGSVLGVGLAFGLQNITANFISGIIMMFGSHIRIGDRIKIDGQVVDVEKIGYRATIVKSVEDKRIIVPNLYFLENMVENLTHGSKITRMTILVGVGYTSDVNKVKKLLLKVADEMNQEYEEITLTPEPFVNFKAFGDSSLDMELFLWTNNEKKVVKLTSAANFKIFEIFNKNGIEIPFPQLDVHNIK